MTPEQIAKPNTESAHQKAFLCWVQQNKHLHPGLILTFHIPNGGTRNIREATELKAQGVRRGVPDICVPIPCGHYHGLYIEFKKPGQEKLKNGGLKDDQVKYRDYLISQNYFYFVAYSYLQAIDYTLDYLNCNNAA